MTTRARRSFDRADLRRATLAELAARLDALDALPRPETKGARKLLANHRNAIRSEIATRAATGKPSASPHRGRKAVPEATDADTDDLRLADFFEAYPGSPADATKA